MRINLQTPFAEKDKAKALGARWDSVRKVWYVVDVADLTAFMRWIPDLAAASEAPGRGIAATPPAASQAARNSKPGVMTGPSQLVPLCDCPALPWEDCVHTSPAAGDQERRSRT